MCSKGERDFRNPSKLFLWTYILFGPIIAPFKHKKFIETIDFQGNENVIDFGCGLGFSSKYIVERLTNGGYLTCIDISPVLIEKAQKRLRKFANVDFKVGHVTQMEFPQKDFRYIFIYNCLHDIDKYQRVEIIKKLSQLLQSGGEIVIEEPIKKSHGIPKDDIVKLMKLAGFKEIQRKVKPGKTFYGRFRKT